MARGFFGARQRANTVGDSTSSPVLTHTDAAPHLDLRSLGQVSTSTADPKQGNTVAMAGRSRRDQRRPSPAFDFQSFTPPRAKSPPPVAYPDVELDDRTIGIALGGSCIEGPTSTVAAGNMNEAGGSGNGMLQRKPSKWKKIGGMFKPKQAQLAPGAGFYPAAVNDQLRQSPDHLVSAPETQLQQTSALPLEPRANGSSIEHNSRKIWRQVEINVTHDPLDGDRRSGTQADEQMHVKKSVGGHIEKVPTPGLNYERSGFFLDVDIPSIQMERYSVMFGSLLRDRQSPGLLARRSRTLGMLNIQEEGPATTRQADLVPPPRLATSPAATRSPTFTLFPRTPTNKSRVQVPLQRSHTTPSPRRAFHDLNPLRRNPTMPSPGLTASSRAQSEWASDRSYLSNASSDTESDDDTNNSGDNDTILVQIRPVGAVDHDEPVWEMLRPDDRVDPLPKKLELPQLPKSPKLPKLPKSPRSKLQKPRPEKTADKASKVSSSNPKTLLTERPTSEPRPGPSEHGTKYVIPPPHRMAPKPPKTTPASAAAPVPASLHRDRPKQNPKAPPSSSPQFDLTIDDFGEDMHKVEISVARSISVTKRPKRLLVPIGARADAIRAGERLVEKRAGTPTLISVQKGHRHEKSQNVLIESM